MDADVGSVYDQVAASPYFRFLLNTRGGADSEEGDKWWKETQEQFNNATGLAAAMQSPLGGLITKAELSNKIARELGTRELGPVMEEFFKRAGNVADDDDVDTLWDDGTVEAAEAEDSVSAEGQA